MKRRLDEDLKEKERMLNESQTKQAELEQKLYKLNMQEYAQKQENERLQQVKLKKQHF